MPGLKSNKYSFFRTLLTKKFCWLPRKLVLMERFYINQQENFYRDIEINKKKKFDFLKQRTLT